MRYIFVVLLALWMAGTVHAQLTFLSDNRSGSVSGALEDANQNVIQSYGQTNFPSAPFADFNGIASGSAGSSLVSSSAGQTSILAANQISFSGNENVSAPCGPDYNSSNFSSYARGSSFFNVTFGVSAPTTFSITERDFNLDGFPAGGSFTLSSANNGVLLEGPPGDNFDGVTNQYLGVLEPNDVYTLQISTSALAVASPNQSFAQNVAGIDIVMDVPEPSSSLLLKAWVVVFGLITILRHRKSHAAQDSPPCKV